MAATKKSATALSFVADWNLTEDGAIGETRPAVSCSTLTSETLAFTFGE
jgi:hypothetical protein